MVEDGMLVQEAARRLGTSESTIRRGIGRELDEVPGSRPKRITRASVERERSAILERLGVHEASHAQAEKTRQTEGAGLRDEIESLRTVIQDLRLANGALLDAIGHVTAPRIPNH